MKKNIKINIMSFLLGGIITFSICVYASSLLDGDVVGYDNTKSGLASTDVQNAVDELYDKATYGDAMAGNILSGKTALINGSKVTGTMADRTGIYTATTSTTDSSKPAYRWNGDNIEIIPALGYWGTWDWNQMAIRVPMKNNGATGGTINPGGSYTIPAGYTTGGTVTANPNQNSGTYTPTSRSSALDMGANNTYRYVNTNSVPNTNSGTYTPTSRSSALDMGATNTYRYVNTTSIYDAGVEAGKSSSEFHNKNVEWIILAATYSGVGGSTNLSGYKDLYLNGGYRYTNANYTGSILKVTSSAISCVVNCTVIFLSHGSSTVTRYSANATVQSSGFKSGDVFIGYAQ